MRLLDIVDEILKQDYKNREFDPGYAWPQRKFYPTQGGLLVGDDFAGCCRRKLYYIMAGCPEPSCPAVNGA